MSRHTIPGLDPAHEVVVGWDPPLNTYFGMVYDRRRDEDDQIIHWVGSDRIAQLPTLPLLGEAMSGYAVIDNAMATRLFADAHEMPAARFGLVGAMETMEFIARYDRCIATGDTPPQSWLAESVVLLRLMMNSSRPG